MRLMGWGWRVGWRAWGALALLVGLTLGLSLGLAACGQTAPNLPGGVYSSGAYHFSVRYPAGWQANASEQPAATAPLIVIITRSGSRKTPGSLISNVTINVLSLSDQSVAKGAAALGKTPGLTKTTLAGQLAYQDQPLTQTGGGNDASQTLTHTDYYLVHGAYEYQISTDALPGDGSALAKMVETFTLLN